MSAEPGYWTAGDVGALLKLSPKTVYRIASGDPTFPVVKIGGSVRFPKERVLRWLREREQGARRLQVVRSQGTA